MPGARWHIDQLADDVAVLGRRDLPRERAKTRPRTRLNVIKDAAGSASAVATPASALIGVVALL